LPIALPRAFAAQLGVFPDEVKSRISQPTADLVGDCVLSSAAGKGVPQ
jgi:hypothetical protein